MINNHAYSESLLIVGDFLFDPHRGLLSGPTGVHHVCPSAVALLSILIGHSDEIVDREALIRKLWPDDDGSSASLNQCVAKLRHYLGDKACRADYIETIPNCGYRLVAPVFGSTAKPESFHFVDPAAGRAAEGNRLVALINEFRKRKVCRSMLIYTLVIWLVFQISEIVVPAVGLPEWVNGLVVVLGILGFPIAAVLSWIFDLTPSGLAWEKERSPAVAVGSTRNRMDLVFDSALVVVALTICGTLVASSI